MNKNIVMYFQELLKKCHQCMEIIVSAKDRQAAEANKNASILLEQIDQEKSREESKKAALARKREKRRKKKKEKQEKEQREREEKEGKDKEDDVPQKQGKGSSKNSTPEPEEEPKKRSKSKSSERESKSSEREESPTSQPPPLAATTTSTIGESLCFLLTLAKLVLHYSSTVLDWCCHLCVISPKMLHGSHRPGKPGKIKWSGNFLFLQKK